MQKLSRSAAVVLLGLLATSCHASRQAQAGTPASSGDVTQRSVEAGASSRAIEQAAGQITPTFLREQVLRISSDASEGRGPSTAGDKLTRAYLIDQLTAYGLEPGRAGEGWEQEVPLHAITTTLPDTWTFEHRAQHLALRRADDVIAGSEVQSAHNKLGPTDVVFVGYGIEAPEYDWNDFKGRDLTGK